MLKIVRLTGRDDDGYAGGKLEAISSIKQGQMDTRCKYLTKVKYENGTETWTCYHEFENRGLIQSCFLPKGGCRYNTGPFRPTAAELAKAAEEADKK